MVLKGRDPVAGLEGFDEAAGGAKAGFAGDLTGRSVVRGGSKLRFRRQASRFVYNLFLFRA